MSSLPVISGRDCARALGKIGFHLKRQHGSHMILRRNLPFTQVVVPDHKELDRGHLAIHHQASRSRHRRVYEVDVKPTRLTPLNASENSLSKGTVL